MYKLKHIPTGLYYQPYTHGTNLSVHGKVYDTIDNDISLALKKRNTLIVYVEEKSLIFKLSNKVLNYTFSPHSSRGQLRATTLLTDWIKEEI